MTATDLMLIVINPKLIECLTNSKSSFFVVVVGHIKWMSEEYPLSKCAE